MEMKTLDIATMVTTELLVKVIKNWKCCKEVKETVQRGHLLVQASAISGGRDD